MSGILYAQAELAPPTPPPAGGLQLRSVSAYFDYYSSTLPNGGALQTSAKLLSDVAGGGSVQVGWLKSTERNNSSFTYTSSLAGRIRYSELNAWNHNLSLSTSHKIAPRWTFGFSARGDLSSVEQSLFVPSTLSNIASTPASFDDLASALLAARFSTPQLASVLNSAPVVESPVQTLLYGQRMFTAGAQTTLSYSYSPRLSFAFDAGANRMQHVSDNRTVSSQSSYLILDTTSGHAGLSFSYSLSPHTQIGGSVNSTRVVSQQDVYTTTSLATIGWALDRHWIVQLHGGVGVSNPVSLTTLQISTKPLPAGGGSLTYKTFEHAFMGSFDRSVSDSYGLGAASTSTAAFTWHWRRPGRSWWLESSFGWQQLQGNGFGDTMGWRTSAGLGRSIGPHLNLFTQYAYLNYSGRLQANPYGVDQSAVRVSMEWWPHAELRR